jgi:hypothetical protein
MPPRGAPSKCPFSSQFAFFIPHSSFFILISYSYVDASAEDHRRGLIGVAPVGDEARRGSNEE